MKIRRTILYTDENVMKAYVRENPEELRGSVMSVSDKESYGHVIMPMNSPLARALKPATIKLRETGVEARLLAEWTAKGLTLEDADGDGIAAAVIPGQAVAALLVLAGGLLASFVVLGTELGYKKQLAF